MDPDLLDELYRAHVDYVWRTVRRLAGDAGEVEDLVHDTFIVLSRRWPDYDPTRPLRPYLFGIAYRVVLHARRRRRRELPAADVELADGASSPLEQAEAAAARRLVLAALMALSLEERAVFVLHELEEESAPEVAAAIGIPVNTVYSRLRRARRKFARAATRLQRTGGGR
jgi:RNA polymerase sigma-70 factor (ECF subfamily)